MLFTDGTANWSLDKARKGQNAMGVSVVEVKNGQRLGGSASVFLRPAYYRQYADAAYRPGAASGFNENRRRPAGERVLGTMQNCANGHTPWGTYLTCEENWSDILSKADLNPLEKRYGISDSDESYRWNEVDERFSVDKT